MPFPLPNITDIFDQIGQGTKYYTVIDCKSGFHQIKVHPDDCHKLAFTTPTGNWEFVRMPFGLRNAAVEFQRAMNLTLNGLIGKGVFVYLDDVVIYAKTLREHEKIFNEVMKRFREANWKLEPDKCRILCRSVIYLGHVLSENGISVNPKTVECVKNFPRCQTVTQVRQFLGLAGYYHRFVFRFAKIAKPLTKLLRKDVPFVWTDDAENSFRTLINALCTAPVLQYPDMTKPFLITTDASGYAVGGILSQGKPGSDLPIAYTSRVLRGSELNYETYEKEALAMIHSVKTFRPYVYGREFTIYTDHEPLVQFQTATLNARVQKWRFILSEYTYRIEYLPGRKNKAADALSRNPVEQPQFNVVTRQQKKAREEIHVPPTQSKNPENKTISEVTQKDNIPDNPSELPSPKTQKTKAKGRPKGARVIQPKASKPRRAKRSVNYEDTQSETDVEAEINPKRFDKPLVSNPEKKRPSRRESFLAGFNRT